METHKNILFSVVGWCAVLALLFIVPISGIAGFAHLLSFLIGATLLTLASISLSVDKDKVSSVLAILLVSVTLWLTLTKSLEWGARIHFHLNREKYEAKVAEVLTANGETERNKICGDECLILSNDPARVSFHYVHGFLNWHDLVYDPTGEAMEPDDDNKRVRIYYFRRGVKHLSGHWYLVHFSD